MARQQSASNVGPLEITPRFNPIPARLSQRITNKRDELFVLSSLKPLALHFDLRNLCTEHGIKFDFEVQKHIKMKENRYTAMRSTNVSRWIRPSELVTVTLQLSYKGDFEQCGSVPIRIRFDYTVNEIRYQKVKYIYYDFVFEEDRPLYDKLMSHHNEHDEEGWDRSAPYDWENADLEIVWLDPEEFYEVVYKGKKNENELEYTADLEYYNIPKRLRIFARWPIQDLMIELGLTKLTYGNNGQAYKEYFHNLLWLEEIQLEDDLKYYSKPKAILKLDVQRTTSDEARFILRLPGLLENRPSVKKGDRIFAIPNLPDNKLKFEGGVVYVSRDNIFLIFHSRFWMELGEYFEDGGSGITFRIEFRLNRLPLRYMHRAVDLVVEQRLENFLFPEGKDVHHQRKLLDKQFQFFNKKIENNPPQMEAVQQIVRGTSRPAPYIIYGPPGTGKTFTLVEAIKQVYKLLPDSQILVCAPSNSAADLITTQLMPDIDQADILRLNASSRPFESCDEKIGSVAYVSSDSTRFVYPSKKTIQLKRVVVSTLSTAGRLVSAELDYHFTHLFIDEAGFSTEPETLVPVCLLSLNSTSPGQVVLAGDPKQLGPVIRSEAAAKCGLSQSLLSRLMELKELKRSPYVKGKKKKKYDSNFITKLVKSFRSHPDILCTPNELFYDGELEASADKQQREKFCIWKHLPTKGFPLIFYGINFGHEMKEYTSPSWYNPLEIVEITKWIEKLLPADEMSVVKAADIGIITPYHQQVKKMRIALRDMDSSTNCSDIEIGSVEKFQGDEREVIIISTVRSDNGQCEKESVRAKLGFLTNEKRFNVAITRAKALLIVVGNPEVLILDKHWRALIKFIIDRGGYTGEPSIGDLTTMIEEADCVSTRAGTEQGEERSPNTTGEDGNNFSQYQQMVDDTWIPMA